MNRTSTNLQELIDAFAQKEQEAMNTTFLSPCVKGGTVCTRIEGVVYTFKLEPPDFEGWGIFKPKTPREAVVVGEASLPLVDRYLHLFPAMRWRVASGEWRVASGEWRVASGEWRVASGEWRVASGEWRVASGVEWRKI